MVGTVSARAARTGIVLIAGAVCWTGAATAGAAPPGVRYSITEIGQLPTSRICDCSVATGVSSGGIVTGYYLGPDDVGRGFIYQNGVTRDIGGAEGVEHAPLAVNDDATAVGFGGLLAFRAHDGQVTELFTLGGQDSKASDINNRGQIVGSASNRDGSRAAMWIGTNAIDLGTLGGELSEGLGINATGQVVGWAWNQRHDKLAFIWDVDHGMRALRLPTPDASVMQAVSVNDHGDAVGTANVRHESPPGSGNFVQQMRGFIWAADGGVIDLGEVTPPLPPAFAITPAAINNARQVIGVEIHSQDLSVPFIWEQGVMRDVNTLVDPGAGWRITTVRDINNAGQIVGGGVDTHGHVRALLLNPIACPGDFNHSGDVTLQDLLDFLGAYFGGSGSADINHDGGVTVQDVLDYLMEYFAGCR
jgi:probable HAF family extracellular repeat protein